MVKQIIGWQTEYGSIHETEEVAKAAEKEEAFETFSKQLQEGLGVSLSKWVDIYGTTWARLIYNNPQVINNILNNFNLV
jgi:hypothetical protein